MRSKSPLRARLALALIPCAAWLAVACGGSRPPGGGESSGSAAAAAGAPSEQPKKIHGDTVEVVLAEYVIDMPDTIPAGRTVFHLRDIGSEDHDIQIQVESADSVVFTTPPLNPGKERYVETRLNPGSYQVVCTVSDHAARGMLVPLVVTPGAGEP